MAATFQTKDVTLYHGDCLDTLKCLDTDSIDSVISSPPYPSIKREYGYWEPDEWLEWMRTIMVELRRVVKPQGSALVVIAPNFEKMGKRHIWCYQFALQMAELWGIVQDAYWVKMTVMPSAGAQHGLMRDAVEWCLWLGEPDCYRNQKAVLWQYSESQIKKMKVKAEKLPSSIQYHPSGHNKIERRILEDKGGSTPFNYLPLANSDCTNKHPASFPIPLAVYWALYLTPPKGVILDMFSGSSTTGIAALRNGFRFVGIEKEQKYIDMSVKRLRKEAKCNRDLFR